MDTMTRDELELILSTARKHNLRIFTFMAIMGYAGLRPSEALRLRVHDVYVMGHIVKELTLPGTNTKTKTGRDVPVPAPLHDALEKYLTTSNLKDKPSEFLFKGPGELPFTIRNMQYIVRKFGYYCLHRHVTPKTFRHTYASLLARRAPIRSVQMALGHANLSSTQVYTHPVKEDLSTAIKDLFEQPAAPDPAGSARPLTYPEGRE